VQIARLELDDRGEQLVYERRCCWHTQAPSAAGLLRRDRVGESDGHWFPDADIIP
jgi:hypothetical protein